MSGSSPAPLLLAQLAAFDPATATMGELLYALQGIDTKITLAQMLLLMFSAAQQGSAMALVGTNWDPGFACGNGQGFTIAAGDVAGGAYAPPVALKGGSLEGVPNDGGAQLWIGGVQANGAGGGASLSTGNQAGNTPNVPAGALSLYVGYNGAGYSGATPPLTLYPGANPDGTNPGAVAIALDGGVPGNPSGLLAVNGDPSLIAIHETWRAADPGAQVIFTATRKMKVTAVVGRPEVQNGTAATLAPVIVPSGTPIGGGTPLTTNSLDLNGGVVATNQTLALISTPTLNPGDSIALVTSGTITASVGSITIHGAPQ